jgi:hypothetical protein
MNEVGIIINVSDQQFQHANGAAGVWQIPAKQPDEEFALLVVYPVSEITDVGDNKKAIHWPKVTSLAKDIVGQRATGGTRERFGVHLCQAMPEISKDLAAAMEAERDFLNANPPDAKTRKDKESGATVMVNIESEPIAEQKRELSLAVFTARAKFEKHCRTLVLKGEIITAKQAMVKECQRLVSVGDQMWARPNERENISEIHRWACGVLRQERPWAYIPQQMESCPGCGGEIKAEILVCPHCGGMMREELETLRAMSKRDRFTSMYPDQAADDGPAETRKKASSKA